MSEYEVLPDITGDEGEMLSASYTANNGIRLQIMNDDIGAMWSVFDLTPKQAVLIGNALIKWGSDHE